MKSLTTLILCYALFVSQALWAADQNTGVISVDNEVTKAQTDEGAASALTLSSLSLFGAGVVAPMYVTWCSNQPSAWVFAGTAAIYVGSEFVNWSKYKSASDRAMKAFLGVDKNEQINSLTAAEKQTREAANAAKRKSLFAKMAAAGFGAASAIALAEQFQFWGNGGACAGAGSFSIPFTNNYQIIDNQLFNQQVLALDNSQSDANALMIYHQMMNLVQGKVSSPSYRDYQRSIELFDHNQTLGIKAGLMVAFEGIRHMALSQAHAGFGDNQLEKAGIALGLAGSAAIVIWQDAVYGALPEWAQKITKSGFTRAAVFGAHSAVAMLAAGQITDAKEKLEKRANQYELLVQQLKQMGEGSMNTGSGTEIKVGTSEVNEFQSPANDVAFNSMDGASCFIQNSKNETLADSTCSCKKTNSCKQAEIPQVEFKGFSLPGAMNRTLTGLKQAGNSLYAGKYLEASTSAGSVLNNAAGVNKMQEALVKKINERLAKNGKKAVDFEKTKKNYANQFNRAIEKSLNSMKPSDALAIRSLANGTSGSDSLAQEPIAKKDESGKIVVTPAKSDGAGTGSATDNAKASDPFAGMNFEVAANGVDQNAAAAAESGADEGYEYGDKDGEQISDKPGVSLFNLISNRYLKTAFPRLFSEQK